jgi:hypothetical protein
MQEKPKYSRFKSFCILAITTIILFLIYENFIEIIGWVGTIITNYDKFIIGTALVCGSIGATHAITKRTTKENVFFLNFIGKPFIAAVFTALTYGLVLNGCSTLFYMILYDPLLKDKYSAIERFAVSTATILLFVASIYGLYQMLKEIFSPAETKAIIERQSEHTSRSHNKRDGVGH